jgi:hypothetical protein
MIANDPEWRPWRTYHGRRRRIFTPLDETATVLFIKINFPDQRLIFTDDDFREIAIATFLQARAHSEEIPPFQCSPGFIAAFKARHGLSSCKLHDKPRPAVTEKQRLHWMTTIRELIETVRPSRIVNRDETSWLLHPRGILTWAEMGCQTVHAYITRNQKDCITVVPFVTASGEKLPLAFIASEKMPRVEGPQIGVVKGHWRTHSESGRQTAQMFQDHLARLREMMRDGPIHLLLDSCSAHPTREVRATAARLGVTLHFISPVSLTNSNGWTELSLAC